MKSDDIKTLHGMAIRLANKIPILAIDGQRNLLVSGKILPTFEVIETIEQARQDAFALRDFIINHVEPRKTPKRAGS